MSRKHVQNPSQVEFPFAAPTSQKAAAQPLAPATFAGYRGVVHPTLSSFGFKPGVRASSSLVGWK